MSDLEYIRDRLFRYRFQSERGLHKLPEAHFTILKKEVETVLGFKGLISAPGTTGDIYRVVVNNEILKEEKEYKDRWKYLTNLDLLIGPPPHKSYLNRCNMKGEAMGYFSFDEHTALWEKKPKPFDLITLTRWKMKKGVKLNILPIFNHREITNINPELNDVFRQYLDHIAALKQRNYTEYEIFNEVEQFLLEQFIKRVEDGQNQDYLFSAHYSSSMLNMKSDEGTVDAVYYPSVQRKFKTMNLAVKRDIFLDRYDLADMLVWQVSENFFKTVDPMSRENVINIFAPLRDKTIFEVIGKEIKYDHSVPFRIYLKKDELEASSSVNIK